MFAIIKICKKWRHYVKDFKYFVQMIIDYANLRNFFIDKNLSRRKAKWWKRLTKFDFKIEYRFDKNNLVDDSSRRRDYENQTAKKNKFRYENLNLNKWTLIESSVFLKNKNEKNKKEKIFFCRVEINTSFWRIQTTIHQKRKKQSTKRRKAIIFKTKIKVQLTRWIRLRKIFKKEWKS